MPISSIILTLAPDDARRDSALDALAAHNSIDIGAQHGLRVPIVVDTPDSDADRAVWQWLHDLDGVTFVDLVTAYFVDDDDDSAQDDDAAKLAAPPQQFNAGVRP